MTGNIRNRNVRFYEEKEADRRAWEILHSEAVRAFPSQNDFIIQAINDFYDRHLAISDDPYLETREKEDAFADRIVEKVEQKVLGNLSQLIGIYLLQQQNILATVLPAYIIPITSAAGGKVPEWESDVGKPDGAQSEGRLSSGSCVFAADRLMRMMCPAYGAFLR